MTGQDVNGRKLTIFLFIITTGEPSFYLFDKMFIALV